MQGKSKRAAAVLAAACAAGLSTAGSVHAYTDWGSMGIAPVSLGNNSAPGNSPRQIGITVANGAVFGGYNIPTNAANARVFKATAPGSISQTPIVAPSGISSGVDKIFYNAFDGNLYFRAQSLQDWNSTSPTIYNSANGAASAIYKMDTNLGGITQVATPQGLNAATTYFSGFSYNYDNGDVLFSYNNAQNRNGNVYYLKQGAATPTQIIQNDGQNGVQLADTLAYMGNGRFADLDSGNSAGQLPRLNLFQYNSTGGAQETLTVQNTYSTAPDGALAGGISSLLWDKNNETLHVMQRMRTSSNTDTLINTSWYPSAGQNTINLVAGGARTQLWHAQLPGAANFSAGDTNSNDPVYPSSTNVVGINASAVTPDGSILVGFGGEAPYGIVGAASHLWLKTTAPTGDSAGRIPSNDNSNWVDLGQVVAGNTQIVGITTGNIGDGSLGSGINSYDVWVVTQDRDDLSLRLSSSASSVVAHRYWDTNGTTTGSGATPNGNWNGVDNNFNTDQLGGNGTLGNTTSSSEVIEFATNPTTTNPYAVTVSGTQTARRLSFSGAAATLSGGTLDVPTIDVKINTLATIASDIAAGVNVEKRDFGTLVFTGTKNSNAGTTTISNGTLQYAQQVSLYNNDNSKWTASNIIVKGGATLGLNVGGAGEFTSADVSAIAALGTGSGGFLSGTTLALDTTNAGGSFAHNAVIANPNGGTNVLAISKTGTGELVLGGSNTYGGGTTVSRGTVTATLPSGLGTGPLAVNSTNGDATVVNLSSTGGTTTSSLSGSVTGAGSTANINNNGQLYTVNQVSSGTYQGTISGAGGGLSKGGNATLTLSNGGSSYSGVTTINAGTIVAGTLADAGSNSSIGTGNASPSAADLVLNGGVLGYNGAAAASSNRQFTLTNAGGGLDVSGAGALTLSNTAPVTMNGSGARTLGLTGGGAGLGTLAAQITNGTGGATGVTKGGTGTWRLNNDTNNFTGPVNINGGVLETTSIGNSSAASAIGAGTGLASDLTISNGTLSYIGSTAVNTNRKFMGGPGVVSPANGGVGANNNSNLGSGAITRIRANGASPAAALTFNSSSGFSYPAGQGFRQLVLGGANTGNNTIGFNITDGGPNTGIGIAVVKEDAGTWVLSGNNNYQGRTIVNGGKLILQGANPIGSGSVLGFNDASGAGFSNQLYIANTGTIVELSTTHPTNVEQMGVGAGTSLVLGGQRLNIFTGASGNGGSNTFAGIISGSGGIAVGPQINTGSGAYINGVPQAGLTRTITLGAANTYTGGTYVQGSNVTVTNLNGLGADFQKLEVSNLRYSGNLRDATHTPNPSFPVIAGGVVTFTHNVNGVVNVANLSGDIVSPDNAAAPENGVNTMTIALGTGGQRILNVRQTTDTVYRGGLSGQNGNAGGGEFRLDAASTGTLTFVGSTASALGPTQQTAVINGGGMSNGGRVRVDGGTLLLKTPGALSLANLPASGPLTRETGTGPTAFTGGAGVVANAGGTVAVNVGGPAPAAVAGQPVVGAEWTAADVDRLKNVGTFNPGSMLGFDTTNAPGGTFTYDTVLGGFNGNQLPGNAQGATERADNTGMGVAKIGAGTLSLGGNSTMTGPTQVRAGTLLATHANALPSGAATVAAGATARLQSGLPKAVTVASVATTGSGKFDITNNSMVIKSSTAADVRTELVKAYNAGGWNGVGGLTSSTTTAETSVGYATNAQLGNLTEFKGVTGLASTDVLVKYTYAGDANLDGKVDIGDLGLLAGAWQQLTGKVWFDGDFTYDGAVDIGDLGLLAGNWQKGTAGNPNPPLMTFNEALAQFSAFDGVAVPEPTGLALLGLGGIGLLGRRRRGIRG